MGIIESATEKLGINISFSSVISFGAWVIIIIILAIITAVGTYYFVLWLKYNKKIIVFSKISGKIETIMRDKARLVKLGDAGDTVFFTRKTKKYLPNPTIQSGRNVFWFYQREDGEWINIGMEDIDASMRKAKAHYLDKEMRYARVGLQRNLKERYQKIGFWERYGGLVAYISLIAITGIMQYLLFDKYLDITGAVNTLMDRAVDVQEATRQIIGGLDSLKGSGALVPS